MAASWLVSRISRRKEHKVQEHGSPTTNFGDKELGVPEVGLLTQFTGKRLPTVSPMTGTKFRQTDGG